MKIYLASGFSLMLVKGREREIIKKCKLKHRLYSFYFVKESFIIGKYKFELLDYLKKGEIGRKSD